MTITPPWRNVGGGSIPVGMAALFLLVVVLHGVLFVPEYASSRAAEFQPQT